jgi:hypothetical protein
LLRLRSEAAFARDREIRIDKRDRVVVAPARGVTRQAVTIITATLLLALALCLGWIGGLNSDLFNIKPVSLPVNKVNSSADPLDAPKSDRLAAARRNAQLIASVRLTETVLHGPSRLTAVPGLKSPRAIISAWTGVPVPEIVRRGCRLVCRAACRRGNAQFDTERGVDMACAPIGQRGLHFLPRNSARIAFDIVQHITGRWRTRRLCRDNRRCCWGRGRSWWQCFGCARN